MDDVKIASKPQAPVKIKQNGRKAWQYIFDVIVKTLLCSAIISIDFTLFANSGSYNMFSSAVYGNLEALYIYAGILSVSFILVFVASFIRPLENILLAIIFGLFTVVIINQFATFDKQSGLLLLFDGIFSDKANIILYEHSHAIIFTAIFLISWIVISSLKRSFLLYLTVGAYALLGWLISEAYFNPQIKYFNDVAGLPNLKKETMGENLIFLSFNDLTSINNIKKINSDKTQDNVSIEKTYKNALGFYNKNNFTLYPNALVEYTENPFLNLIQSYNAGDLSKTSDDNLLQVITNESYFNFKTLQNDKIYMKNNTLYDMLRKNEYKINVFQTRDIDACYVDNNLVVSSCKEKINSPISLNSEDFTVYDKLVLLAGQWIESTKLVKSANTILKPLEYAQPYISKEFSSKGIDLNKVYSFNSIKIFDQLINTIDKLSGNQAYFAIIDLPSDNYVYDEFCKIKPLDLWTGVKSNLHKNSSLSNRQKAYAEQLNCLYGSLEKFIEQLRIMGEEENTTIIIQGLNNPLELIGKNAEYYKQIQNKQQVTFAIKRPSDTQAKLDYSVCSVPEIINSIFFDQKQCKDFAILKTTDKNIEVSKNAVNADKINDKTLADATISFNGWFDVWRINNGFSKPDTQVSNSAYIKEAPVMNETIDDIPEEKMESITLASDKTNNEDTSIKESSTNTSDKTAKEPIAEKTEPEETQKPSKLEEVAQKTFKEVSAKVDEIIKNKNNDKKENIIDRINNATDELSANIDNTVKTVTDKVAKTFVAPKADKADETNNGKNNLSKENIATQDNKKEIEDTIAKTKKAVEEKIAREKATTQNKKTEEIVHIQSQELKNILEAPVADGQNLSPEELKKIYHQKISNATKNNNIQIEVIEK